jgi:ankyrin repeat protein
MKVLFAAIRDSDMAKLSDLLEDPAVAAGINDYKSVPGASGRHVLHYAIEHGAKLVILDALVAAGADINKKSHNGQTPLTFAVAAESLPTVNKLLELGANVDSPGGQGLPALTYAAMADNIPIMQRLLEAGADVNKANGHGQTALEMAARAGHMAAVKLLLGAGASVTEGLGGAKEDMPAEMLAYLDAQIRGRGVNAKMAAIGRTHGDLPEEILAMVSHQASGVKKSPGGTYRKVGGRRRYRRKTHRRRRN